MSEDTGLQFIKWLDRAAEFRQKQGAKVSKPDNNPDYDRGVAVGMRWGQQVERQVIIDALKLVLETRILKANGKPVSPTIGIEEAIALINGEQK